MPRGRPQLPKSSNEELNKKREYYRNYARKRRKELVALAEESNKDYKQKNTYKEKHKRCTKKVGELTKKLKSSERKLDKAYDDMNDVVNTYDKKLAVAQRRSYKK